jgi:hypothetical protein
MNMSARGFLRVVGFMYAMFGAAGIAASLLPSIGLLIVCGFGAMMFLVTPPGLVLEYGIQAACFGQSRGPYGCNLDADVIQRALTVIMALSVMSFVGGLSGAWAASTKDQQAGRAVWLALVVVSLGVALWSSSVWFTDGGRSHPLINGGIVAVPNAFWSLAYATAYFRWWRKGAD